MASFKAIVVMLIFSAAVVFGMQEFGLNDNFRDPGQTSITEAGPSQTLGSGLACKGKEIDGSHTFYCSFLCYQRSRFTVGSSIARDKPTQSP